MALKIFQGEARIRLGSRQARTVVPASAQPVDEPTTREVLNQIRSDVTAWAARTSQSQPQKKVT